MKMKQFPGNSNMSVMDPETSLFSCFSIYWFYLFKMPPHKTDSGGGMGRRGPVT